MNISRETQAIIEAFSDPILIIGPSRGSVVAYNRAFVHDLGFAEETFSGKFFLQLPQFSRAVSRGLIKIYIKARRGERDIPPYVFQHSDNVRTLRTVSAFASPVEVSNSDRPCVMLRFQFLSPAVSDDLQKEEDAEAFDVFSEISCEPWIEFRPSMPITAPQFSEEDRRKRLSLIGQRLKVARAGKAAVNFYGLSNETPAPGEKAGARDFLSFFYREDDALRLLDILATIGFVKAGASLVNAQGQVMDAEVSCSMHFGEDDSITALYCIFHFSEELMKYRTTINENRIEREFVFNQPFLGLGRLAPNHPLDRPDAANADEELGRSLDSILIVTANAALAHLHKSQKSQFLMHPMSILFPDRASAVQVLKELFVTRKSSFTAYGEDGTPERITVFKAMFNNADQITGIFIASSPPTDL